MLRDFLLAAISAPLSDSEVTRILGERTYPESVATLEEWLAKARQCNARFQFDLNASHEGNGWLYMDVRSPYTGKVGFYLVEQQELLKGGRHICNAVAENRKKRRLAVVIIALCADDTDPRVREEVALVWNAEDQIGDGVIVMEPSWTAAILIEQMLPILLPLSFKGTSSLPYFEATSSVTSNPVTVRRVHSSLQSLLGAVIDEPGTFEQKWRQRQQETIGESEILLCTTFLPPVTHSHAAITRFYELFGATKETCRVVKEKAEWEEEMWLDHIRKYQRIDIIDRSILEEYLAAPEYYQMPLTKEEIEQQITNLVRQLEHKNYTLCLTPEAVDMSYEIRGSEVRVRTDRRNKGQPRLGRISGLVLNDSRMTETFEREFWTMFRLTESQFKEREYVNRWLQKRSHELYGRSISSLISAEQFDVFLCHASADKPEVRKIATQLKDKGITVWFDEWNLVPGRPWQRVLEAQIRGIGSAAVFVGRNGVGPWTNMELDAFMHEFIRRGCPVIPVILPSAEGTPDLPVFLRGMHWVDFRKRKPAPLEQLIWGIKGKKDS